MPELPGPIKKLLRKDQNPEAKLIADAKSQAQEALVLIDNAEIQTIRKSFTCEKAPPLDELRKIDPDKPETHPEADLSIADLLDARGVAIIRYYADIDDDQPERNDFGHVILVKQGDKIVRFAVKNGRRRDPLTSTKQRPLSLDKGKILDPTFQPHFSHTDEIPAALYPNLRLPSYMFGMWLTANP